MALNFTLKVKKMANFVRYMLTQFKNINDIPKSHSTVHFKWVNCILGELYLNEVV